MHAISILWQIVILIFQNQFYSQVYYIIKTSAETSSALGEVNNGQVLRETGIARRAPKSGAQQSDLFQ